MDDPNAAIAQQIQGLKEVVFKIEMQLDQLSAAIIASQTTGQGGDPPSDISLPKPDNIDATTPPLPVLIVGQLPYGQAYYPEDLLHTRGRNLDVRG